MSEHEDYAHIRDPQAERTKWELWAIVAIVVVVVVGSIVWRAATYHPGKRESDGRRITGASTVSPGDGRPSSPPVAGGTPPQ